MWANTVPEAMRATVAAVMAKESTSVRLFITRHAAYCGGLKVSQHHIAPFLRRIQGSIYHRDIAGRPVQIATSYTYSRGQERSI